MPFLIDLHLHTKDHSFDGKVPAVEVLAHLRESGFSGAVFTDHEYLWPDEELWELRRAAALPDSFLLLSGQEVRTMHDNIVYGDLLVFGADESIPDDTSPLEVFRRVAECGGFAIAAHPAVPHIGFGPHAGKFPLLALETWNGRYGPRHAREAERLARTHGLPGVGGSDGHRPDDYGRGGTLFAEMPRSLADIARAIKSGDAKPWRPGLLDAVRRMMGR